MAEETKIPSAAERLRHYIDARENRTLAEWEELAGQGNREAMLKLIELYSPDAPTCLISAEKPSSYVEPNPTLAFQWLLKLADSGNWQGRHWLADCYFSGQHVDKADSEQAIRLLEKNAEEGDYKASKRLACYYTHGKGVKKDFRKAIKWLENMASFEDEWSKQPGSDRQSIEFLRNRPSAIGGKQLCPEFTYWNEEPRHKLAELYIQGGTDIEQDFSKAVEWLEKAVNFPRTTRDDKCRAQLKLGEYYLAGGPGLEQDISQAITWFEEATECYTEHLYYPPTRFDDERSNIAHPGYDYYSRQAHRKLGICYALGKGKEQDYVNATEHFKKAARAFGVNTNYNSIMIDPRAEAEHGICHYRLGEVSEARECFERSANKGDMLGNLWLAYLESVKNEELREKVNYVSMLFRHFGNPFHQPSDDEKQSIEIDKAETEIDRRLRDIAVNFEKQVRNDSELNLDMLSVSNEVIDFLNDKKSNGKTSPAKIILALFYQQKRDRKRFLGNLNKARKQGDVISNYLLGLDCKGSNTEKSFEFFASVISSTDNISDKKADSYSPEYKRDLFVLAREEQLHLFYEKANKQKVLEAEQNKEKEMLSFFTHTMRNALSTAPESLRQAIRLLGSDDYEKNQKHYEAINEITTLFSTISLTDCLIDTFKQSIYDTEEFQRAWKNDNSGEATPQWFIAFALRQSLNRIIFMDDTTGLRKLIHNKGDLIKPIRKSFLEQVLPLDVNKNQRDVEEFFDWLKLITALEVNIEKDDVKFGTNQVKFSLMFAISSELILNSLKYWSGTGNIQINWFAEQEYYVFSIKNACKANAKSKIASTHKGIAFISRLIELLGKHAQFNCAANEQMFTAELKLHKTLLEG